MTISFATQHKSFSDVFPYVAIANDLILCSNPDKLTAVLELHVSAYDTLETMQLYHDKLMRSLCDLPADATVSIYYCKTFNTPKPTVLNASKLPIVNFVEQNKADMVLGKTPTITNGIMSISPTYSCYMSISIPVSNRDEGDFKLIRKLPGMTAKKTTTKSVEDIVPLYKETKEKLEFYIKGLMAATEGDIYRLSSQQILQFLSIILNHDKIDQANDFPGILKSDWNTSLCGIIDPTPGYVYYGGNYHTVLSLRAKKLPQKTNAGLNRIFTHPDIKNIPYIIQQTIHFPSREVGLARARDRANMISTRQGFSKNLRFLEKTPEGIPPERLLAIVQASIKQIENSFDRFLEQHFHVFLWSDNLDKLHNTYKLFDATVSTTYKLKREKINIKSAYFSLLPGNEHIETIRMTLPSYNIADLMPIDLPRYPFAHRKSKMELFYHNEQDSFAKIDPFDPRCDNHNAMIVGGSGSGKSFTAQDILWQVMKYNPCISIVDFGGEGQGSYLSFVKNLGGTYLEVNFNSDFSINPFDGPYFVRSEKDEKGRDYNVPDSNGQPDPMQYSSLMATLERIILGESDKEIPATVRTELRDQIVAYYRDTNNNESNEANLNEFAEKYLKTNPKLMNTEWDLYKMMMDFVGQGQYAGIYARFFKSTKVIVNDDIICFDMAGLNNHGRLKSVLVPTLISMITQKILGAKSKADRKKFLIQDEAWRDLCKGGAMQDFLIEQYRTIRKMNGQITLITKSLNDILTSKVADALMVNTSYYWLIGNKHDGAALAKLSCSSSVGKMELSDYDINRIIEQQSKRDFYLLTPYFAGQLRLYPTKEFAMLATTNPDEKAILRKHMLKLGVDYVTPEVIKAAIHEF